MALFKIVAVTLFGTSVVSGEVTQLRGVAQHKPAANGTTRLFRQTLINDADMQYAGEVFIGGQKKVAIIDSGSFDIVALSDECERCGKKNSLYSPSHSPSYVAGKLTATQTYGSGTTDSRECWEHVSIGSSMSEDQSFWQVYDADMPILGEASFQMIFGVGPPAGAEQIAQMEADWSTGDAHLEEVLTHVKNQTFYVKQTDTHVLSTCLHKEPGSPGVFIWNDAHPATYAASYFVKVPVIGGLYWAAKLEDVTMGDKKLACFGTPCMAVMDTGTSLVAGPSEVIFQVDDLAAKLSSDCQDLSALPNLEFKLNGQQFSLPSSLYMGEVYGEMSEEIRDRMEHTQDSSMCDAAMMTLDEEDPDFGQMWIFGLPFFRKYYSSFVLDKNFEAEAMYFSEADNNCEPTVGGSSMRRGPGLPEVTRPMRINAKKIRAPKRWAKGSASRVHHIHSPLAA